MAQGLYRWPCGCEGRFDGLCERVTKQCNPRRHTAAVGSVTSHRYEPEDNGAVRLDLPLPDRRREAAQIRRWQKVASAPYGTYGERATRNARRRLALYSSGLGKDGL